MIFHGVTATAAVMAAALFLPHFLHHLPLPEALLRFNAKILDNSPLRDVFFLPRDLDKFRRNKFRIFDHPSISCPTLFTIMWIHHQRLLYHLGSKSARYRLRHLQSWGLPWTRRALDVPHFGYEDNFLIFHGAPWECILSRVLPRLV